MRARVHLDGSGHGINSSGHNFLHIFLNINAYYWDNAIGFSATRC